jgi:PAS domain S-box-containing protein
MENYTIKILHLEDVDTDAELVARLLRKSNIDCEVKIVNTKTQYKNALQDFRPEIILSDHTLPAFNSMEALEILRGSGLNIPFILVTGAVSEEFGVMAIKKGVDDYILKDRLHRLPIAVRSTLEKYRVEKERLKSETYKEQARIRIAESEKQYVQLIHDLPAALYTCNADGRIMLYNKAAVALWGREPEIGEELWCGSLKMYDKDNIEIPREDSPIARTIRAGVKIEGEEIIIERPDGSKRYVMTHPSPNFNSAGKLTGASNMMIDITESKKANLESLMLVDRLQLKNKELGQFGYMISHNLRAPIARILGLASIFGVEASENKFIVDKIAEATIELDTIVRDINIVISARNSEREKREFVSFQNQLRLVTQVLHEEIAQSKAIITSDFQQAKGTFTVRNYFYSILYNILSNAIKFRSPEVLLSIHIHTYEENNYICLSVKDNGMGIDLAKNGSKLFGLFKTFSQNIAGKGIGLHLVKTQVESLGGKVDVDSKINEGSEFRIYLPKK